MQLTLSLLALDLPEARQQAWDSLENEQRQAAIEKLSRLIAKAVLATESDEEDDD